MSSQKIFDKNYRYLAQPEFMDIKLKFLQSNFCVCVFYVLSTLSYTQL